MQPADRLTLRERAAVAISLTTARHALTRATHVTTPTETRRLIFEALDALDRLRAGLGFRRSDLDLRRKHLGR